MTLYCIQEASDVSTSFFSGLFPLTLIIKFFVPVRRWVADDVGKKAASATSYVTALCYTTSVFLHFVIFFLLQSPDILGEKKNKNKSGPNFRQDPCFKVRWKWRECQGSWRWWCWWWWGSWGAQHRPCFPAVFDPSPLLGSIDPCSAPFIVSVEYQLLCFLPPVCRRRAAAACSRIFH